jgi:hypothetical protein
VGGQAIKDESQNLMALLQAAQDLYLGMAECVPFRLEFAPLLKKI